MTGMRVVVTLAPRVTTTLFSLNLASTKFSTREIKDTRRLKSRNLILYNINKIIKFKLLLYNGYYCYSNMSELHV